MSTDTSLASRALSTPQPSAQPAVKPAAKTTKSPLDVSLDIGFDDLIDVINPLQHLPVISSVYREVSGDTIGLGARLAGGYLYGGPIGAGSEAAMAVFEAVSGDTPMGHVASLFTDDDSTGTQAGTQVAAATATSPIPWIKDAAPPANPPTTTAGSSTALAAALDKIREKATEATPVNALKPQLDPALLAQYYRLNATRPDKGQTVRI